MKTKKRLSILLTLCLVAGLAGLTALTVWAAGLISGLEDADGNAILDPTGSATRAQLAAIMTRFVESVK